MLRKLLAEITLRDFLLGMILYQLIWYILTVLSIESSFLKGLILAGTALLVGVGEWLVNNIDWRSGDLVAREHISYQSSVSGKIVQIRGLLLCFPLSFVLSGFVRDMAVNVLSLPSSSPAVGLMQRASISLFWFSVIAYILDRSRITFSEMLGYIPCSFKAWLFTLYSIPLFISALFLVPLSSDLILSLSPGLISYLENLPSIPSVYTSQSTDYAIAATIFTGVFIVVVIPVYEEILFRGIILNRCSVKFGIPWAIVISSLFFGFLHLPNLLGTVFFSVILSWIYIKTQSLYVPILCHMAYNAIVSGVIMLNTF